MRSFKKVGIGIGGLLFCLLLTTSQILAQEEDETWQRHGAIGVSSGTSALFSGDIAINVIRPLTVKFSYNHFDIAVNDIPLDVQGTGVIASFAANQSSAQLSLEYNINKKGSLRLVGGGAYYLNNYIDMTLRMPEDRQFNDVSISVDDIGEIKTTLKTGQIAPYMGIGLGRSIPKKRIGLSLDVGGYYRGPFNDVEMVATNLLKGNTINQPILEANLADETFWYPSVTLRLGVKLF